MPESALSEKPAAAPDSSRKTIVLATTVAVADIGLGDALAAGFGDRWSEYTVKVASFPEGGAAAFASKGVADVMLVDGDAAAKSLISQGFAVRSTPVMEDRLVIVGPVADPAGIKKAGSFSAALARIADAAGPLSIPGKVPVRFLGGTSSVERTLWAQAGRTPSGGWYIAADKKASKPVAAAAEGQAYAIVSKALYSSAASGAKGLTVLVDGGRAFATRYYVLPLAGASDPRAATRLDDWLVGPGRNLMISFNAEGGGTPAFSTVGR